MITNILRVFLTRSFKPFVFKGNNRKGFDPDARNLGLYIHIPFCTRICSFCPYYKVLYNRALMKKYIGALHKEIQLVSDLGNKKTDITSIYFGGGSPALAVDFLPGIMSRIGGSFNLKGNTGIELHPRDINKNLVSDLKSCGFDMVSIGVQSFQDKCLKVLGREGTRSREKVGIASRGQFKTVDVDLIFGIPGQSPEDLVKDFKIAVDNGATQISTYPFIEFSYSTLKSRPMGRKVQRKMLAAVIEVSKRHGFERTAVWTFSKKDHPRYSSVTRDNYIGFGPSAATLLKDIFKINTFSVEEYVRCLDGSEIPTALTLKFNKRRRVLYWLFWSSYNLHLDRGKFRDLFDDDLDDLFGFEIFLGKMLKLIKDDTGGYKVTGRGVQFYHLLEQAYTHQYIDKTWRTATRNPWPEKIILY